MSTNYPWLDAYCRQKKGASKDFKEEWGAYRYLLGAKMFAMQGSDKEGRQIISLKLSPEEGAMLRGQYQDIRPGYYLNKDHWNSLNLAGDVPDDVLRYMVDASYRLVYASLPKKVQREIDQA